MTSVLPDFSGIKRRVDQLAEYYSLGWLLLPLCWPDLVGGCGCGANHPEKAVGKAPLVALAAAEAGQLSAGYLRARLERNTGCNVGVLLAASDLLVIDADSAAAVAEAHALGLPAGATAARGGERRHFVFANPTGVRGRAIHRGTSGALDILSSGFVVLPPSRHRSGDPYRWVVPPAGRLPPAPAWAVEMVGEAKATPPPAPLPSPLPACDVYALPIPHRIRRLIVHGPAAEPGRYRTRSEALFACLFCLIAAGCTDAQILSILIDPAHGISGKPREQGAAWLVRDLARAREQYGNVKSRGVRGSRTVRFSVL